MDSLPVASYKPSPKSSDNPVETAKAPYSPAAGAAVFSQRYSAAQAARAWSRWKAQERYPIESAA
jgi:hypothetical protein